MTPDIVTDQTSAHDALLGYVPERSLARRGRTPARARAGRVRCEAMRAMATHVRAMLALQSRGAVVFDYGNNLRAQAEQAGVANAFDIPGFVPEYVRPLFCEGKGPFRWAALSGDPADIRRDRPVRPRDVRRRRRACAGGSGWPANESPFRACRRESSGSGTASAREFGLALNDLVRRGVVQAPIVIGRDHLDAGSVASPNRETEGMLDGSDAIADWPVLNALLNTSSGATWVSVHHGGGVGIGYSLHAGMVVVADGSREADEKLERVLTSDPGIGVARHADAGYPLAIETARERGVRIPMLGRPTESVVVIIERPALERRILASTDAGRIPVVLGGCGSGRTSLLLRIERLVGADRAQYLEFRRDRRRPRNAAWRRRG